MSGTGAVTRESKSSFGSRISSRIDRTVFVSQSLFSLLMLGIVGFVVLTPTAPIDRVLFAAGALLTLLAWLSAATVPWNRFGPGWVNVIPLADVLAVALMHLGLPHLSTAVLWIFPIMWLATSLSGWALTLGFSIAFMSIAYGALIPLHSEADPAIPEWFLLPVVLIVVAIASATNARRRNEQRQVQAKQAEMLAKALARARSQEVVMSEILDAVNFGIVRITSSGEITVMNQCQRDFERVRGEDDDIFEADGLTRLSVETGPRAAAVAGETFTDRIIWYGRAERQRVALAVSATRLQSAGASSGDILMVYRDVTEQVNAVRARDDLLSSVSHELRTPLTSMMGYLDLVLEDDTLPSSTRSRLDIVERNGDRLLELITQILEASRGDTEVALTPEWADLAEIVAKSVEMQQLPAMERGIRVDTTGVHHQQVRIDVSRIRQVVDNMLSNAIKYNRDYGLVTISTEALADDVLLRISDTGFGVTPEELSRVFDRHFRSERVRNSSIHGNGLGLSISRDIVRQHGGELEMMSAPGEGSTLVMTLPQSGPSEPEPRP